MKTDTNLEAEGGVDTKPWIVRNYKWLILLALAALVLSRFSLHLGYVGDDKAAATRLIAQFHERVNAGRFEEIYDDGHPAFKNTTTKQDWLQHMQENHEKYGVFEASGDSKINVLPGAPVQIRAACVSKFEKGEATELFSFVREGSSVRLLIYGISPGNTFRHPPMGSEGR